jgi:hypothetical protein
MAKTIGQLTQTTTLDPGDEFVIEQSGLTQRVAASVVRGGLVDADIDAAAAIAGSKLADDAITTAKIDDDAVTTAKILDANVTPAKLSQPLTLETAKATTSGTSIDFTGIPSWVKRITVMLSGVSTNGSSSFQLQIGDAGGIETTSYVAGSSFIAITANTTDADLWTTGFGVTLGGNASTEISGIGLITNLSGNTWVYQFIGAYGSGATAIAGGTKTLSDTLDRIRLTTANGTDTFDAGSVNIMYEG